MASSTAAASRTVRHRANSLMLRMVASPKGNATRPRDGLSPTRPHQAAGIRIDPAPSLPWAIGTSPAATAAAAPPDDPLGERLRSHGLQVGPNATGWQVAEMPNSGMFVLPTVT